MKPVLTVEEMREVDARTMALGIPGVVLMENAGSRVVEFLESRFSPLEEQRIVLFCGKGNNGGDGLVVARQLFTRFRQKSLDVVLTGNPDPEQLKMYLACGGTVAREVAPGITHASLVIDAILGTGLTGPARGTALDAIRQVNTAFPLAKVVAVDVPSGVGTGEFVRADYTVTFTAWKAMQAMPPTCDEMGEIVLRAIGSPDHLMSGCQLWLLEGVDFRRFFAPRPRDSNKGTFGHVLVIAGSPGKTGAAMMCGSAALRMGAGLVTVTSDTAVGFPPELMTEPMAGIALGRRSVVAMGPGLGTAPETVDFVRTWFQECAAPMVVDADALNCLAGADWRGGAQFRVLTPHPGEMARLTGKSVAEVQADRLYVARGLAVERQVVVVLKGQRTLIALPDGRVWINPTGSPAMAKGGSGDVLTGLIAGMLAQHPGEPELAVAAAVYLHGLAGEIGGAKLTEQTFLATDLLTYLADAIRAL